MKTKLDCMAAEPAQAGVNFKHDFFVPGGRCRIGSLILLLLVAAVLACTRLSTTAGAQSLTWNESDVDAMWTGYTNDFYVLAASGHHIFGVTAGNTTITGFWEEANEIAMAEDGYDWATTDYNSLGSGSAISSMIDDLCAGFVAHNGSLWSADQYDDDILWATMAFARAYQITGDNSWLADATNNFNYVWANGQEDGVTDGSLGLTQVRGDKRMYANVNFTFVIAGDMLYDLTGNSIYKSEADVIFNWSKTNLYVYNHLPAKNGSTNVCSMIYNYNDSEFGKSIQIRDEMYNYGIAIQAADFENDTDMAVTVANWMIYNINADTNSDGTPYAGTYDGYNVLPDYGAGGNNGDNNCGYDGIALRGFGFALMDGLLANPDALPFAQANVQSAWNHRGSDNVEWCGWTTSPSGTKYSWGDSSAMAGMFDIPAPVRLVQDSGFTTGSSSNVTVSFPSGTSAGDLLVVTLAGSSGATFSAPSGWIFVTSHAGTDDKCSLWYYTNCPAGITNTTFTYTGSTFGDAVLSEWAGVSSLDVKGNASTGSGTSLTVATSSNTTARDEVAITEFIEHLSTAQTVTLSPASGWEKLRRNDSSSVKDHVASDHIYVDASGSAVSEMQTSSVSGTSWTGAIATFKP